MKDYYRDYFKARTILCLSIILLSAVTFISCSKSNDAVKNSIEQHLKDIGVRDVNVDLFVEDPNDKSRAYASATVTYNFAKANGQLQKEYVGYILKQEGQDWKIERTTTYLKEEEPAREILDGGKPSTRPYAR